MATDPVEAYRCDSGGKSAAIGSQLRLRPARMADADWLLDWAQGTEDQRPAFIDDLRQRLPTTYIAEVSGVPVGQVTIDGDMAGYTVGRQYQGRGYEVQIIEALAAL